MLRVAIIGYGRMGHEVEAVALERGHRVVLKIDKDNAHELNPLNLKEVDVAIEFTVPQTVRKNVEACLATGIPVVCGTTGWNNGLSSVVEKVNAGNGTFFYASNYSVGVNIFFRLNSILAKYLAKVGNYTVDIQETHHTQKLDAPSGTAISLANIIAEEYSTLSGWSLAPAYEAGKISIESVREGTVPGTHTVNFESEQDRIVLSHIAKNRRGFALGAILAAEFIVGKKGYYTMDDLLHFD
ncbi:MAG: 4-hydroxy-tetrahydrodipicolinate reductase [Bacteroidales bacterium]